MWWWHMWLTARPGSHHFVSQWSLQKFIGLSGGSRRKHKSLFMQNNYVTHESNLAIMYSTGFYVSNVHILTATLWLLKSFSFLKELDYTEDINTRVGNVTKCEYFPTRHSKRPLKHTHNSSVTYRVKVTLDLQRHFFQTIVH